MRVDRAFRCWEITLSKTKTSPLQAADGREDAALLHPAVGRKFENEVKFLSDIHANEGTSTFSHESAKCWKQDRRSRRDVASILPLKRRIHQYSETKWRYPELRLLVLNVGIFSGLGIFSGFLPDAVGVVGIPGSCRSRPMTPGVGPSLCREVARLPC